MNCQITTWRWRRLSLLGKILFFLIFLWWFDRFGGLSVILFLSTCFIPRIRLQLSLLLAVDSNFELAFEKLRIVEENRFCQTHPNIEAMIQRRKGVVLVKPWIFFRLNYLPWKPLRNGKSVNFEIVSHKYPMMQKCNSNLLIFSCYQTMLKVPKNYLPSARR